MNNARTYIALTKLIWYVKDKDFKYRYSTGRKDSPVDFVELALSNSY